MVDSEPIPDAWHVKINFDYIKDVTEFIEIYEKKNNNDAIKFLNNYLIFCFLHKKLNYIKTIITRLNLDTTFNTKLTYVDDKDSHLKINVTFLWFGVLCNDIDFVKFILEKNKRYDDINNNYFNLRSYDLLPVFDNTTPFYVAAVYTKNRDVIDLLIERGANINTTTTTDSITPLMKVYKETNVDYYDFLISRGAKIDLRCINGMTVLHYLTIQKNFNVALHLLEKYKDVADPYALDNKNRNVFMMFAIELSSSDYFEKEYDILEIIPSYKEKEMYIEKLLKITNPPRNIVRLVYDLFAACINYNPSLKRKYFNKAAKVVGDKLLSFNNNNDKQKWIKRFNSIVENDTDEGLYIKSIKVMNRLLMIYDCNIIEKIIEYILPFYSSSSKENDKYVKILLYLLDVVTDNIESYMELYSDPTIGSIYWHVLKYYITLVVNSEDDISPEIHYYKYFRYMLKRFIKFEHVLKEYKYSGYNNLVENLHYFLFYLYKKCYYDETKRKCIENIMKTEYPINLLTNANECILHTIFERNYIKIVNKNIAKDFLFFLIKCTNFKYLNLKKLPRLEKFYSCNETPIELAINNENHVDIIKLLLNNGCVIPTDKVANLLHLKNLTLNS